MKTGRSNERDKPGFGPEPERGADSLVSEERWLRCASCGERIVRESARIDVNGSHEHAFMNPSGLRFVVGCWSSAPGCLGAGERSSVWTWFPGFAWQAELCRACFTHLGWSFHAASSSSFYGLIRERLI